MDAPIEPQSSLSSDEIAWQVARAVRRVTIDLSAATSDIIDAVAAALHRKHPAFRGATLLDVEQELARLLHHAFTDEVGALVALVLGDAAMAAEDEVKFQIEEKEIT